MAKLRDIGKRNVALDAKLLSEVMAIIEDVRHRGDAALIEYTERFDGYKMQALDLRVNQQQLSQSAARADSAVLAALQTAIANVRKFHERERSSSWSIDGPNQSS